MSLSRLVMGLALASCALGCAAGPQARSEVGGSMEPLQGLMTAAASGSDAQDADPATAPKTGPDTSMTSAKDVAAGKPAGGMTLRQQAQNPVADLISVPFQFNSTQNSGQRRNQTNVLNIQPVYPVHLNDDWNLINRLIVPLIQQPQLVKGSNSTSGLGDTTLQMFFSPKESKPIWGVGPILYFPTASDDKLGTDQWGLGPTAVALDIDGPWVYGAVGQHLWSVGGPNGPGNDLDTSLVQPFVNYNMDDGWYLNSAPVITANWKADSASDIWTVPVGGGIGRVVHSKIPVNYNVQAFYNVHHPHNAGNWSMRLQITLLLPKDRPGDRPKGTT